METTNIILIVGITVLVLDKLLKCVMKVKKSKCCGGEVEMMTPPKEERSLATSNETLDHTVEEVSEIVKRLSTNKQDIP